MKKIFIFLSVLLLTKYALAASMADYKDAFKIILEKDTLPQKEELETIFNQENRYYDKKYGSVWDLLGDFDAEFYAKAATYGINEKRLKWEEEDLVLEMLAAIPKDMYPYIGPMLFEIPNMSEKVLNIPEIKKTKNQFPKRIAPQLQDIEDIEFLSPGLYFLLIPEFWPENFEKIEVPQQTPYYPKTKYNSKFYSALKQIVPPKNFMQGADKKISGKSNLRTIHPDANSLITAADVEAFVKTLPKVEEWFKTADNEYQISIVSSMLWSYEATKESAILAGMRELVNPCARLVQKAKLINQELALANKVAKEGFTLNEWAYTCDKTVKAYRLSLIHNSVMQSIRLYKLGLYDDEINKLSPKSAKIRFATMQAIAEAYSAPISDMLEVQKKRSQLEEAFKQTKYRIGGIDIRLF